MANNTKQNINLNDIYISKEMAELLNQFKIAITPIPNLMNDIIKQGEKDKLNPLEIRTLIQSTFRTIPYRTFIRYLPDELRDKSKQRFKTFAAKSLMNVAANDSKNRIEKSTNIPDNQPTNTIENPEENLISNSYNIPENIRENNPNISIENPTNISDKSSFIFSQESQTLSNKSLPEESEYYIKKAEENILNNPTENLQKLVDIILENPDKIFNQIPTELLENYLEIPDKINVEFPTKLLRNMSISSDIELTAIVDLKHKKITRIF